MTGKTLRLVLPRILWLMFLLSACAAPVVPSNPAPTMSALLPQTAATPTIQAAQLTETSIALPFPDTTRSDVTPTSPGPSPTPTPDVRLKPDEWQKWPVVPEISARALEIYRRGLANGNDPAHFSVVGDCQSIPGVFLGDYDTRNYTLNAPYLYLQETINQFQGSFLREGMAVRGGFTAASLLSPIQADPEYCKPGEAPLTCEFRLHKPSLLVISLETWADPKTVERYEDYLRQIIERSIEQGTLPLLGTKADVAEVGGGRHVINPIIAKLAYEYDLPLWNFWRAAQGLPNGGIDASRDGFHLTKDGWRLKSFIALQALDAAWRAGSQLPPGIAVQASPTPTTTPTPAPAVSTPPSFCVDNPECVLFGLMESLDGNLQYKGVFWFDLTSQRLSQAAPAGYNLQDLSPDKQWLLVNQEQRLILAKRDGSQHIVISEQFFDPSKQGAFFLENGQQIAWVGAENQATFLYLYDIADGNSTPITQSGDAPIGVFPSPDLQGIYWQKGACSGRGVCTPESIQYSRLDGSAPLDLGAVIQPVFAADGIQFAFMDPQYDAVEDIAYNDKLVIERIAERLPSRRLFVFPASEGYKVRNRLVEYAFSPDSSRIFAMIDDHSAYFEKSLVLHTYVITLDNSWLWQYQRMTGDMPQVAWAPDSRWLLLLVTQPVKTGGFRVNFQLLDTSTSQFNVIDQNLDLFSPNFMYVTNIFWP